MTAPNRVVGAFVAGLLFAPLSCSREATRESVPVESTPSDQTSSIVKDSLGSPRFLPPKRVAFKHSPFGLHAAGGGTAYARELNAQFIRKIVLWHEAEPRPGQYRFPGADRYVKSIQRAGLDLAVTLRPVSRWGVDVDYSALKLEKPRHPWTRFSGYPRQMSAWLEFVRQMVERYDGDGREDMPRLRRPVRHWQIGNEIRWQWQGNIKQYVDLLAQTSRAIRAADPDAQIILGALTDGLKLVAAEISGGSGDGEPSRSTSAHAKALRAIDYVLKEGAPHFDIVDFHAYDDEPYGLALQICWLRERMKKLGYSKRIWTLENAGPFEHFTRERFSEHLVKRHVVALAYGVEGFFWSSLNPTLGWSEQYIRLALLDRSRRKTPAYYTYRVMANKLDSIQLIEALKTSAGVTAFRAQVPGRVVYIVWSDQGEQDWSLSLDAGVVRVTHLVTRPGIKEPRVEQMAPRDGVLKLRVSAPVFVEP